MEFFTYLVVSIPGSHAPSRFYITLCWQGDKLVKNGLPLITYLVCKKKLSFVANSKMVSYSSCHSEKLKNS